MSSEWPAEPVDSGWHFAAIAAVGQVSGPVICQSAAIARLMGTDRRVGEVSAGEVLSPARIHGRDIAPTAQHELPPDALKRAGRLHEDALSGDDDDA